MVLLFSVLLLSLYHTHYNYCNQMSDRRISCLERILLILKWAISPMYFTALICYTGTSNTKIQSYRSFSTRVITPKFQTRQLVVDFGVRLLRYEVRWWLRFTSVNIYVCWLFIFVCLCKISCLLNIYTLWLEYLMFVEIA